MNFKKTYLVHILIINSFISFTLISPIIGGSQLATPELKWEIEEGRVYTWVVKASNLDLGYLPVGSKYDVNVTSINLSLGFNYTEVYATITEYNSQTHSTITLLENGMFIYFNYQYVNVSLYTNFYKHGFFAPTNYSSEFANKLYEYLWSFYRFDGGGYRVGISEVRSLYGFNDTSDLTYRWNFQNSINYEHIIAYQDNYNRRIYEYHVLLEEYDISGISYGNFFLIISAFIIVSLIYIYRKNERKMSCSRTHK